MLTRVPQWRRVPIQAVKAEIWLETSGVRQDSDVSLCVCVCVRVEAQIKSPSERILSWTVAAIRLIGRRGQQGSIDGSIALSIWWPEHIGLANRGLDARHARAAFPLPRLELLCTPKLRYINTEKSIRSLMLIYATTALSRQPPWPAPENVFNAGRFMPQMTSQW